MAKKKTFESSLEELELIVMDYLSNMKLKNDLILKLQMKLLNMVSIIIMNNVEILLWNVQKHGKVQCQD